MSVVDLSSTIIYLTTFGITIFFSYLLDVSESGREKLHNSGRTLAAYIFPLLIVLIPSILAGMRADTVGVDVKVYVTKTFNECLNSGSFFEALQNVQENPLFVLISYISARFFGSMGFLLFLIQLLTIVPIYKVAYIYRKSIPLWLSMAVYLFVFYNNSLNVMRQSIACSFILLAFVYWLNGKKLRPLILFLIACGFHGAAIIGAAILLFTYLISKRIKNKITWLLAFAAVLYVFFAVSHNLGSIAAWLISKNIISSSYRYYLIVFIDQTVKKDYYINPFGLYALFDWTFRLLFGLVPVCLIMMQKRMNPEIKSLSVIYFTGFALYSVILFGMDTMYGCRLTLQMDLLAVLLLPYLPRSKKDTLGILVLLGMIFTYWYVFIMRLGWSGTNLYLFR